MLIVWEKSAQKIALFLPIQSIIKLYHFPRILIFPRRYRLIPSSAILSNFPIQRHFITQLRFLRSRAKPRAYSKLPESKDNSLFFTQTQLDFVYFKKVESSFV